ncbi:MAG: DUF3090 domain-containing protein [Chloroflexota bacterium]
MTRRLFIFDGPDRFVAGTVGEPGERAFFLQARKGGALISVGLEKVQVAALAQRLEDLLDAVEAPTTHDRPDELTLEQPVIELFRVGAMALAWDAGTEAVVIEAQTPTEDGEYVELPDDAEDGPDLLRVRIDASTARGFVRRAEALMASGRPACPFCGQPLDPQGHFCPRGNGQLN